MKSVKNILSLFLVLSMIVAGLPVYNAMDTNRDDKIDLKDAVSLIKVFTSQVPDNPSEFREHFENMVSSLSIIAGLKSTIKPTKEASALTPPDSTAKAYLIAKTDVFHPSNYRSYISSKSQHIQSVELEPASPPPRCVESA